MNSKKIYHICHKPIVEEGFSFVDVNSAFRTRLNHLMNIDEQWSLEAYAHIYVNNVNDCDSGLCLVMSIYMRLLGCPIIINENDIDVYRFNFAYWMMSGSLGY